MESRPAVALGVSLRLTTIDEGGRATALVGQATMETQYRPNWGFAGLDHPKEQTGAPVFAWSRELIQPGEDVRAVIVPMYPEHWEGVEVGAALTMYEGYRVCGLATVVEKFDSRFPVPEADFRLFQRWAREGPEGRGARSG